MECGLKRRLCRQLAWLRTGVSPATLKANSEKTCELELRKIDFFGRFIELKKIIYVQ